MGVVGFGLGLQMAVEKNQKSLSIFALSTVFRRRLPFDERMLVVCPIWLIDAFLYPILEVLNVFGRRVCLVGMT